MKFKKKQFVLLFIFVPFLTPDLSFINERLDTLISLWKVIIMSIFLIMLMQSSKYIVQLKKIKHLCAFLFIYILSTITYGRNNIRTAIVNSVTLISISILLEATLKKYGIEAIKILRWIMECMCILNLLSVIALPKGFIDTLNIDAYIFFWGYDNGFIWWDIVLLTVLLIESTYRNTKKMRFHIYFCFMIVIFPLMIRMSASGLVVAVLYLLSYFYYNFKSSRLRYISPKLIWGSMLLSISVVFLKIQYYFSWIINVLLKKDIGLSGRYDIWKEAIVKIAESPLIGYGAENDIILTTPKFLSVNHCHNFILNILYVSGFVGLISFFVYIEKSIRIMDKLDRKIKTILTISISLMFVSLITESQQNMLQLIILLQLPFSLYNINCLRKQK